MPTKHKSEDFKMSAVEYYLTEDVSQEQVCRIFNKTHNNKKQSFLLLCFRWRKINNYAYGVIIYYNLNVVQEV